MATVINLHIGRRRTAISVRSDPKWPGMWRIHDGEQISDMVNLTRAKDAAMAWAVPNGGDRIKLVRWVYAETHAEAPYSDYSGRSVPYTP